MARVLSADDQEYLKLLKDARIAIIGGAQSYSIGTRSLTRANLALILDEIKRLEGGATPKFRRGIVRDI